MYPFYGVVFMTKVVPEIMVFFCPFCGHDVDEEDTICGSCDEPMKGEPADADYYDMVGIPYTVEEDV